MKRPGIDGGFILCFLLNLLLNVYWAIPAVVLFVLHFALGTPLWLGWLALVVWVAAVFGITAFMSWAVSTSDSNSAGTGMRGKATIRYSSQNSPVDKRDEHDGHDG